MSDCKSEIRDGMMIDWDVPIEMGDCLVLRADVFRPLRSGDLADMHRGAGRISHRSHRAREGLCIFRRDRSRVFGHVPGVQWSGAVSTQRFPRPSGRDLRRYGDAAYESKPAIVCATASHSPPVIQG